MSDSHGLAPVQGRLRMSITQYPTSRSCLSATGSSLRFLCGVGVYSSAMTTLPSMDGGGAPEGRVGGVCGGVCGGSAAIGLLLLFTTGDIGEGKQKASVSTLGSAARLGSTSSLM